MKIYPVVFVVVIAIVAHVFLLFLNNKSATSNRAYTNAELFAATNKIEVDRINCTGDGDGSGYGTCTIIDIHETKTHLECTSDFIDVTLWKATGCKEQSLVQISE